MEDSTIINVLTDLAQLDIDAVLAYEQALEKIEDTNVHNNIDEFRNDHIRHINDLSQLINEYGGVPPENTPDLKGYLIEGFTYLRSITGTRGALNAMKENEKTTNKTYKQALEENPELPDKVKKLLMKNYDDEKRHLAYITETLENL